MAPVQSRLVLAVTIPAAALAIFFSLFWLRRSSKGHPPSPPDKDNNKAKKKANTTEQSDTSVEAKNLKCDSVHQINLAEKNVDRALEEPLLSKKVSSFSDAHLPEDTCEEETVDHRPVLSSSLKEDFVVPSKTEDNNIVELPSKRSIEEKVDTFFVKEFSQKVNDIEIDTVAKKDSKDNTTDKVSVNLNENKISDVAEKPVTVVYNKDNESSFEVPLLKEVDSEQNLSDKQATTSEMIKEESTASPVKLGFDKVADMEKAELAEKFANLDLDAMKANEVDVKERDSANHSPSENMLASPSMSNFSDAHSEGSSDSGKGHSDGTTSPSRTPAGGSSVSGDPSPSVYEFVIPQVIVGRLIGRHGVFLHEIMSATHTSIFIKVHPDTTKLKICAIEGSQGDIDKALEMIRKKFPPRRYPKLTLERVSFVPQQQLRSEDFHLQLIEGVNNDVIVSSLLSPGQFFVQQPFHPSYPCLTPLTQSLTQTYSATDAPALVSPVPDAICVCPSLGGWYRAQIVSVDEDLRHCDIKFVDYGGYLRVESLLLKQIRADFLMLPFQAVECSLANIQPIHESGWSEEARVFIHNITFGRILQSQVVAYTESGIPLVNLFTSINTQVVMVNEELVANGFAVHATPVGSLPTAVTEGEVDAEACAEEPIIP